jgi:hypothetical protein
MTIPDNGSGKRRRRHFSGQEKVAIVKAHLVDGVADSDLYVLWQLRNGCLRKAAHSRSSEGISMCPS